jgi:vacuolar iron transporter family protein
MPQTPHVEKHFTGSLVVRDVVIGMSDGLTVPFALAAGLSGAVNASHIVVTAGLAEMAAGSISMGLGGYLAGRSDIEHYQSERHREEEEIVKMPKAEAMEVTEILGTYGLTEAESTLVVEGLEKRPRAWVDFMMRFELGLEEPDPKRALSSALTIGGSYVAGGIIPLLPYIFIPTTSTALIVSVIVTLTALFIFGAVKGRFTGVSPLRSGLQTLLIGGIAAAAAFIIARLIT